MEGISAGAASRRIGVIDGEALLVDGVSEVDAGSAQIRCAHPVSHDGDTVVVCRDITIEFPIVEVELIAQTRAAARLHCNAQAQIISALCGEQGADLFDCHLGEGDVLSFRHDVLSFRHGEPLSISVCVDD